MPEHDDFARMLGALAEVFCAEGRTGGDVAAAALSETIAVPFELPKGNGLAVADGAGAMLRAGQHAAAPAILAALPLICWHHSGLESGRIRTKIALAMATAELIGPDGMIFHPRVRVGLFVQSANLNYVTRTHPAEESFVMLGGAGYWSCNGSPPRRQIAGAYIFHRSGARHSSVTRQEPLIAAWRWTGDIAYKGYSLDG